MDVVAPDRADDSTGDETRASDEAWTDEAWDDEAQAIDEPEDAG